jgi:hypothetical protein
MVKEKKSYESKYPRHTFYISKEDIYKVEDIATALKRKEGRKTDKSDLIREAIKDLIEKYKKYL